ncbi:alpha/beta hydrolase [Luteimonas saliphila]|uniref:alpha/beta hydrolase n=1 Tax=Luteimonas saliphila TaxID=2804919 RepID=UPI00192DC66E|nr:alpha/beta hydrolase [Luteimonas saliphila]
MAAAPTTLRETTFRNGEIAIAAQLHLPPDFDQDRVWPAIVLSTPGNSVKEQVGTIYARKLAARGFVAIAFDPSHQGASGGAARDLEDPGARVEDLRCAVDHLVTLPFVDEARIAVLGICAGGGYAVNAALTEHRFKVVATVAGTDVGRAFRRMLPGERMHARLAEVGRARTAAARGAAERRERWIPDSLDAAGAEGITDRDLLEAIRFHRESPHRHPNASNRLLLRSVGPMLGFDGFHLVPDLLVQPLMVIVAGRQGSTCQYETGQALYGLARGPDKALVVIPGAGHYDLYHRDEHIDPAIERLAPFFHFHLDP